MERGGQRGWRMGRVRTMRMGDRDEVRGNGDGDRGNGDGD